MKTNFVSRGRKAACWILSIFFLLNGAFLDHTRHTAAVSAAAAETTIDEMEPNDDLTTVQVVPFPNAGDKVIIRGDAADGDKGFMSEEVENFSKAVFGTPWGRFQDVFIMDPDTVQDVGDGPIQLRITLSWDRPVDLDMIPGTTVDDGTFFLDGFKGLSLDMIQPPDVNPESWPRSNALVRSVVLYLQPKGIRSNDQPLPNDGFGRKLVLPVKNWDTMRANYVITIERGGETSNFTSEEHHVDDDGLTWRGFGGFDNNFLVNCFQPSRYPATLTTISHLFFHFSDLPDPTGQPVRVIVVPGKMDGPFAVPESNPTFLFDQMVKIPQSDDITNVTIEPPLTFKSGVVCVGFELPPAETTGVAPIFSVSANQYLRTFASEDKGMTWGRPLATEKVSGLNVFMSAAIRATFTYAGSAAQP